MIDSLAICRLAEGCGRCMCRVKTQLSHREKRVSLVLSTLSSSLNYQISFLCGIQQSLLLIYMLADVL